MVERIKLILILITMMLAGKARAQNVGIATASPQAKMDINGDLVLRSHILTVPDGISYALDVVSNKYNHYKITGPTSNYVIAGIMPAVHDRMITLQNSAGHSLEIYNDDPLCLQPENRILTGLGSVLAVFSGGTVTLQYDIGINRWRVIGQHNSSLDNFGGSWIVNGQHLFSPNAGNIGIGVQDPVQAGLQSSRLVNNTAAIFGSGHYGVSVEANNPSIGLNFYDYGTPRAIKGNGHSAMMGLHVPDGEFYLGVFGNKATDDFGAIPGGWMSFRYIMRSYRNGVTFWGRDTTSEGKKLIWYGDRGALRAGNIVNNVVRPIGEHSIGLGANVFAGGKTAVAIGQSAIADADYSVALGFFSRTENGVGAVAVGSECLATGSYSTAIGSAASTNNKTGSVCIGTVPSLGVINVANLNDNEFMVYAHHYRLWTSNANTGVYMTPGANSWLSISNRNMKENFEPVAGEEVLKKLAVIPLSSWNYKTQDPATFRHYGMNAQDFFNAFGKDRYGIIGNDTAVNPIDMIGIAYSGIQALESRTRIIDDLQKENEQLRNQVEAIKNTLATLERRLALSEKK